MDEKRRGQHREQERERGQARGQAENQEYRAQKFREHGKGEAYLGTDTQWVWKAAGP
jgi:hypothetical protein